MFLCALWTYLTILKEGVKECFSELTPYIANLVKQKARLVCINFFLSICKLKEMKIESEVNSVNTSKLQQICPAEDISIFFDSIHTNSWHLTCPGSSSLLYESVIKYLIFLSRTESKAPSYQIHSQGYCNVISMYF